MDGAEALGIFEFIFGLIVFSTVVSLGLTYVAGRAAWRGGKRLLGWARDQKLLPGTQQNPSREAEDVVVEPVTERATRSERPEEHHLRKTQQRPGYTRLVIDDTLTADQVIRVMRRLQSDQVLGRRARSVIDTLDSADLRLESLLAELDEAFQRGSISWEKFATPSYGAYDAILRNSALLANRMQSFDTAAYLRLKDTMGSEWRNGDEHTQAREERWKLFKQTLDSFDEIIETNENLLLELDKLAGEVSSISASGADVADDAALEEIRRLIEEAKYYR